MLIIPSKIHFVFLFSKSESICKKIRSIFNSSIVSFDKTFKDEYKNEDHEENYVLEDVLDDTDEE